MTQPQVLCDEYSWLRMPSCPTLLAGRAAAGMEGTLHYQPVQGGAVRTSELGYTRHWIHFSLDEDGQIKEPLSGLALSRVVRVLRQQVARSGLSTHTRAVREGGARAPQPWLQLRAWPLPAWSSCLQAVPCLWRKTMVVAGWSCHAG